MITNPVSQRYIIASVAACLVLMVGCGRGDDSPRPELPAAAPEVATPAPHDDGTGILGGIAIIGDSNSDEYRADDNRGDGYAAVTFNWVELLVRYRGLDFGPWGTRPPPRRTGYAYNWALSGATVASAISGGQHSGVARQVADGTVSLVFIYLGFNDFARQNYAAIYRGAVSGNDLQDKVAGVIDGIATAVDSIQSAGRADIIVINLYDYSLERPALLAVFPDEARRRAVTDAIREVNEGLAAMAEQRGVVLVDLTAAVAELFAAADEDGFISIAGVLIDTNKPGNEPHHLNLHDSSRHGGTVSSALFANSMFIAPANAAFGAGLVPFSEREILEIAGIAP